MMAKKDRAPYWDHIQSAAIVGVRVLGVQGRVSHHAGPPYINCGLYTERAGKFWYGDILFPDDQSKLDQIAKELGTTVYVIPDLSIDDERPIKDRAFIEVAV